MGKNKKIKQMTRVKSRDIKIPQTHQKLSFEKKSIKIPAWRQKIKNIANQAKLKKSPSGEQKKDDMRK